MNQSQINILITSKLPKIVQYQHFQNPPIQNQQLYQDPQVFKIITDLKNHISKLFKKWQIDPEFQFQLPDTKFIQKKNKPLIAYHQPNQLNDQLQVRDLNQQQFQSIKKDGTFFVKSNYYSIPYKWKLSEWIYKGSQNIFITFKKDLARAYSQIYQIKQRFISDTVSLKKGAVRLYKWIPNALNLLIGLRKFIESRPDYESIIQKQRQKQIMTKLEMHIEKQFYELIYIPQNLQKDLEKRNLFNEYINKKQNIRGQFLKQILEIDKKFNQYWIQNKKQIYRKLSDQAQGQILKQRVLDIKYKIIDELLSNKFKDSRQIEIKQYIQIYKKMRIIKQNMDNLSNQQNKVQTQFRNYIDLNYPIRRYSKKWRTQLQQQNYSQKSKQLKKQTLKKISNKLDSPIFNHYIQFEQNYQKLLSQKKIQFPLKLDPSRTFKCPYKLFPPYKIQQRMGYNNKKQYILIRQLNIYIQTNFIFWKIALNFVRWYTWTRNIIYWLFRGVWGGRLGLKVLFYKQRFYPKYNVNPQTGMLQKDSSFWWDPIRQSISQTCYNISKSREQFEESPDNGFFGKSCARVFNLIQNYFIRLIIILCLYLIIIKPIIIVLNVIICTFLAVTAILWVPVIILLYYIINITIYNFDFDQRYASGRISQRFFPIFSITIKFIYDLFYTIISILGVIYHPLFSFILILFGFLRYFSRTIYDFFMYGIIKCSGRSPVRDTGMAWKISGPGLSRQYYQSIKQSDVYILLISKLQSIQLNRYQTLINSQLNSIKKNIENKLKLVFKPFDLEYKNYKVIDQSIQFYKRKLNIALNERRNRYPSSPGRNIRFTEVELKKYFQKSIQIVKYFIINHKSQYLFEIYSQKIGQFEDITEKIWIQIFGQQILEPFQQLDQRFQLINDRQDEAIQGVIAAIQDQLTNDNKIVSLKMKRHKKLQQIQIFYNNNLVINLDSVSYQNYFSSRNNPMLSILINYNIKDIIKNQKNKQTNPLIDQNLTIDGITSKKSKFLMED